MKVSSGTQTDTVQSTGGPVEPTVGSTTEPVDADSGGSTANGKPQKVDGVAQTDDAMTDSATSHLAH